MAKSGLMNKRIPTLLGILILIGGLVTGVVLVNSRQGLESKAGPTESPKNVKVSNRGATTFSVSWTTDIPLTGLIKYSEDPAKITTPAGDARDQISGTSQGYTNHLVNVIGAGANKTYYFLIVSGSATYDDNGKPFQVRTTAQVVSPPEDVIFGKIVGTAGEAVNGAIVFVEAEGGETLSTISRTDGTWRLNLANSRDSEGKVLTYDPIKTLLSIFVQAGSSTATAITDTSKDSPVPDIVLGKNQSFIDAGSLVSGLESTESAGINRAGFQLVESELALSEKLEATASVKILNPAVNGEIIATDLPEFRGKAPAGTTVKLTVDAPAQITQVVTADADGNWTWTPPQRLSQGGHILTAEYTDSSNELQKITRTFTILASSGLPAFTATPSATVTLTPTPTVVTTMPASESEELTESGGLMTTLGLSLLGVGLLIFGSLTKKKFR